MNIQDTHLPECPQRVGFLLIDGFALLSYACAVEPLRAANLLGESALYRILSFAVEGSEARSSSGAIIPCQPAGHMQPGLDVLMVVAGGDPLKFRPPAGLVAWLRQLDRAGVTIGGVSGGPAILAMAGLMQGRRMTVHWEHAPALLEAVPEILLEPALYIRDRNRITCAGGTAPLDLMHVLIAEAHGHRFARLVSDWFMHTEIRHWRQPQRASLVERHRTNNRSVLIAIEAMEGHVAEPLTLGQLAGLAEISKRQLNRLFVAECGMTAMEFYRKLRVDVADGMLTGSTLGLTEIALATGFADASHFSRAFGSARGMPPAAYRRNRAEVGRLLPPAPQ